MRFDTYLDRFHSALSGRKVLTNQEIRAAASDGVRPETLAATNDDLAREYDEALANERVEANRR